MKMIIIWPPVVAEYSPGRATYYVLLKFEMAVGLGLFKVGFIRIRINLRDTSVLFVCNSR